MMRFRYAAFDSAGRVIRSSISAGTSEAALAALQHQGIRPFELTAAAEDVSDRFRTLGRRRPLALSWRASFFRQLATLLAAGVAVDRALSVLMAQTTKVHERIVLESCLRGLSAGASLSTSLAHAAPDFARDEIGMVRAGEQSGNLAGLLHETANLLDRRVAWRARVTSALLYPALLVVLTPVALAIIGMVLVPNLAPLFENSGLPEPLFLRLMVGIGEAFAAAPVLLIAISILAPLAAYATLRRVMTGPAGAAVLSRLPLVGTIRARTDAARISTTMATLLGAAAPLQLALSVAGDVATLSTTRHGLQSAQRDVADGHRLSVALKAVPVLGPAALRMIAIGEDANRLPAMLGFVAAEEDRLLTAYLDRIAALLGPLLTIAIGLLIGGIVTSIMRAILAINELALQ